MLNKVKVVFMHPFHQKQNFHAATIKKLEKENLWIRHRRIWIYWVRKEIMSIYFNYTSEKKKLA